jgi:ABC-type bacteriocin/lantibiotic exporter with double-glycine peptidase domain
MLHFGRVMGSLDSTCKGEIGEMLQSVRVNRTILIVARRAGALRHCDIVYELAAGIIAHQHSCPSLLSRQAGHG